jgi:hypothetical protein
VVEEGASEIAEGAIFLLGYLEYKEEIMIVLIDILLRR